MDLLEHPLEAVAFRLYSLPDASAATGAAAWTCLAAVLAAAAAAGLWRLRSSTPTAVTRGTKGSEMEKPQAERMSPEPATSSGRSRESASSESTERSPPPAPSPKERYTAYYHNDGACVGCCDVDDEEGGDDEEEQDDGGGAYELSSEADPFRWEAVRSLPLSPAAGYWSPMTLSGSVVRLWDQGADGGLTAAASPRRRGRGIGGTISAF